MNERTNEWEWCSNFTTRNLIENDYDNFFTRLFGKGLLRNYISRINLFCSDLPALA